MQAYQESLISRYFKALRMPVGPSMMMYDYSLFGMVEDEEFSHEGRREVKTYSDERGIVVKKVYTDVFKDFTDYAGNTYKRLFAVEAESQYLLPSGEIAFTRQRVVELGDKKREDIYQKRREQVVSGIKAMASGSPLERLIQELFSLFATEIGSYIRSGSHDLVEAVMTTQDDRLSLETGVDHPDGSRKLTVRELLAGAIV